jgi:hypothetical protein
VTPYWAEVARRARVEAAEHSVRLLHGADADAVLRRSAFRVAGHAPEVLAAFEAGLAGRRRAAFVRAVGDLLGSGELARAHDLVFSRH